MTSTLSKFFIFAAGATIGSVVTWKVLKTKYEQIAQEEIESVKEVFSKRNLTEDAKAIFKKTEYIESVPTENIVSNRDELYTVTKEKPDIRKYAEKLKECSYVDYSGNSNSKKKEEASNVDAPYVIAPEEFGENEEYETVSLTYYSDKILTDDSDNLIEDVEDVVGYDSLTHFGEYEDDSVFVRNDRYKTDYEILLDTRNYHDVINKNPHLAEDE